MADSFLGRWSQRKQAVREGKPLAEPAVLIQPLAQPPKAGHDAKAPSAVTAIAPLPEGQLASKEVPPALSLQDVQQLTAQSDFAPFVARDVAPDVRNAAMKKLFADPHYNVMDGLDIYIDDYAKPDPLPESMLRQMASAKFLNLFADEEAASPDQLTPNPAPEPALDHDHPDLRLQPNDAAGPEKPGRGAE